MVPATDKLRVSVPFEGEPDPTMKATVFAFDQSDNLLASAPVVKGYADLVLSEDQRHHSRLFVAPSEMAKKEGGPTVAALRKAGAYQPAVRLRPGMKAVDLLAVPQVDWRRWLLCGCRVRGRVVRPVQFPSGIQDMPVCNARVRICEVDPVHLLLTRVPDDIVYRIAHTLLERPIPIPEPDPDPAFVIRPDVLDVTPQNVALAQRVGADSIGLALKAAGTRSLPMPEADAAVEAGAPRILTDDVTRASLASRSATIVRQSLLDNVALIRPYLCLWSWLWPWWYTCDEVAVVYTDGDGRFDTTIWYPCHGDRPDLNFRVEYPIGDIWTTVYSRPAPCGTYWDYACGTEVTIRVSDPRVPWCGGPQLEGMQVAVISVGNRVSFDEIRPESAGATAGLTTAGEPFGGSLEPTVWFGSGLLASGVTHYKWSFKKVGEPASAWRTSTKEVVRHYAEEGPGGVLTFKPFLLGPDPAVAETVFKIPPATGPGEGWTPQIDARENTASFFFRSHLEAGGNAVTGAGKYEMKLELFRIVGGVPQRVDLTAAGIDFKVPVGAAPFGAGTVTTVGAPGANLVVEAGRLVAFRWVLHVDNNPCQRDIANVHVGDVTAGPCGFIQYPAGPPTPTATIAFRAFHPNGFARFTFTVVKGSTGSVGAASAGGLVTDPSPNGFTPAGGGWFVKHVPVTTLLNANGSNCAKAAFAESIDLDALATDGWGTLTYLDSIGAGDGSSLKAFALDPVV